jgi:hypothetical protein
MTAQMSLQTLLLDKAFATLWTLEGLLPLVLESVGLNTSL